jgi:transcriptional regulator with XRE-family HTH domain
MRRYLRFLERDSTLKFEMPDVEGDGPDPRGEKQEEPMRYFAAWEDFLASEPDVQETVNKCDPAANLKAFRKRTKRTQTELAIEIGVSRRSLQDMEAGRTSISSEVLIRLHGRYGLDLQEFLTGNSAPTRRASKEHFAKKAIDANRMLLRLYRDADLNTIKDWAIFMAARVDTDKPVTIQDVWEDMPEDI